MRGKGAVLVLGILTLTGLAVIAFLAQRPPQDPPQPPAAVARVGDVSGTPRPVQVVMRRGADRVLQRERIGTSCGPNTMGCTGSFEVRAIAVFLVRDDLGALRAFIGEDPRNGCALEWKTLPAGYNWYIDGDLVEAVFQDMCHGSQYDRRGRVIGGPSPFDLNELATEERSGQVYVHPSKVLVGACRGCPR